MEVLYPFLLIILYAAVVFSVRGLAQADNLTSRKTIVKRSFKIFLKSLDSDVPGIVESTIYNIITIKKFHPNADYAPIILKLKELAEENNDPAVRYKAHLAANYLSFNNVINAKTKFPLNEREYIFTQIAEQLENKLAVSN